MLIVVDGEYSTFDGHAGARTSQIAHTNCADWPGDRGFQHLIEFIFPDRNDDVALVNINAEVVQVILERYAFFQDDRCLYSLLSVAHLYKGDLHGALVGDIIIGGAVVATQHHSAVIALVIIVEDETPLRVGDGVLGTGHGILDRHGLALFVVQVGQAQLVAVGRAVDAHGVDGDGGCHGGIFLDEVFALDGLVASGHPHAGVRV